MAKTTKQIMVFISLIYSKCRIDRFECALKSLIKIFIDVLNIFSKQSN